ncbi:14613_t:CDS:1, partial [Cetraspora pellucida]
NFEYVQLMYLDRTNEDVQLLGKENLLDHNISEFSDDLIEILTKF